MPGIWKNIISHPNYGMYEYNFWQVYTIFTCGYENLQEFDPKYIQRSRKGQKRQKKA